MQVKENIILKYWVCKNGLWSLKTVFCSMYQMAVNIKVGCVDVKHGTLGTGTSAVLHASFLVGGL
jgi:hypothetical protein